MRKPQRLALAAILRSLQEEPEKWTFGKYEAVCGRMEVWMQNRYFATRFNYGSIASPDNCNPFWWLFPWNWWRVKLIHAIEDAQASLEFSEFEKEKAQ